MTTLANSVSFSGQCTRLCGILRRQLRHFDSRGTTGARRFDHPNGAPISRPGLRTFAKTEPRVGNRLYFSRQWDLLFPSTSPVMHFWTILSSCALLLPCLAKPLSPSQVAAEIKRRQTSRRAIVKGNAFAPRLNLVPRASPVRCKTGHSYCKCVPYVKAHDISELFNPECVFAEMCCAGTNGGPDFCSPDCSTDCGDDAHRLSSHTLITSLLTPNCIDNCSGDNPVCCLHPSGQFFACAPTLAVRPLCYWYESEH